MDTTEMQKKYEKDAVLEVIRIFDENKIKLTILDFNLNQNREKNFSTSILTKLDEPDPSKSVTHIFVRYDARWKAALNSRKDNFLNYANVSVSQKHIHIFFTWKELDFIRLSGAQVEADTDKEKIEKVKRKIEKLLALADFDKNPSEQEAVSASLKVQKLLAEYHLSMAEIYGEEASRDCEAVYSDLGSGSSKNNWRWNLARAVANGYCCKNYCSGKGKLDGEVVFFGFHEDIILARRVYTYLFNVGNRLGNEYAKKSGKGGTDAYQSFVYGYVRGIDEQLQAQCTALALTVQPEVVKAFHDLSFNGSLRSHKRELSAKAFEEGREEGRKALSSRYIE